MLNKSSLQRNFLNLINIIQNPELYSPIFHTYVWRIGKKFKLLSHPKNPFANIQIPSKDLNSRVYYILRQAIDNKTPLMMGRYGNVECETMRDVLLFEKRILKSLRPIYNTLCKNAGFFPKDLQSEREIYAELKNFALIMQNATANCDIFGTWSGGLSFEHYFIDRFAHTNLILTELDFFRPQVESALPFSYAFKDATVLVIHPFEETIRSQYQNYDKLFANKKILPSFNLKTFKAIQTINKEIDTRFATWFEALDWMTQEINKISFDIALIGCGAYGFPLAARIKNMGKIAIHCGGATQLFFGIKGKRWEEEQKELGSKLFNNYWVRPNEKETIKNISDIEGGCYW